MNRIVVDIRMAHQDLFPDVLRDIHALLDRADVRGLEAHLLVGMAARQGIPDLQRRFAELLGKGRLHIVPALPDPGPERRDGSWRAEVSGALQDAALAGLAPDVVLQMDLSGHAGHPPPCPVVGFLSSPAHEGALDGDRYITPVETVRRKTRLPSLEGRITVIPPGADPRFTPPDMTISEMASWRDRHRLDRPYILVATPSPLALETYAALPDALRNKVDLVLRDPPVAIDLPPVAAGRIRTCPLLPEADWPILFGLADIAISAGPQDLRFALEVVRAGAPVVGMLPGMESTTDPGAMSSPPGLACEIRRMLDQPARRAAQASAQRARTAHLTQAVWADRVLDHLLSLCGPAGHQMPDPVRIEDDLIARLRALSNAAAPHGADLDHTAAAVDAVRRLLVRARRPRELPDLLSWQFEGPFDSSYSLAVVNRETARGLARQGVDLALVSAEGPGPFAPNAAFLQSAPEMARLHARSHAPDRPPPLVTSRNMFPPRVDDITSPYALLHGYAWEETGLPAAFAQDFETCLDGALVTSEHVRQVFVDQGLSIPLHVVGNGVDHLDRVTPEPLPADYWPVGTTRFLHVSACFPRKGVDVLLEAFAMAFDGAQDVALLIKTHPNPHNTIHDQIADLKTRFPGCPPIRVLDDDLSAGQMRTLYTEAHCLVVPSRAEGFCLPVAEAVLAGTPVIATGWSGQTTFAGNPLVSFCDYTFVPAQSHLDTWDSVWAEPDRDDLAARLRAARDAGPPDVETAGRAAAMMRAAYGWDGVAANSRAALRHIVETPPSTPARIGWVSTFNTRCGIATYSAHLVAEMPDRVTVFAAHAAERSGADDDRTIRCWSQDGMDTLAGLDQAIRATDPEILVIQFNFGFYALPHLEALVLKARQDGRSVVMMMHATDDTGLPLTRRLPRLVRTLKAASRVLVHSVHDLNRLKEVGVTENVALFPHGVPALAVPPATPATPPATSLVLASYGFMLPQKGLPELVDTLALLRQAGWEAELRMVNADYPSPVSASTKGAVQARIAAHGLEDHVTISSDFLPDTDSLSQLAVADLLVFPYRPTQESASGAVRLALAADRPIAVTPLPIFDDVAGLVTPLPGSTPEAMAEGLAEMAQAVKAGGPDHPVLQRQARARTWRDSHSYAALGPRLWRQLQAVRRNFP